ncbi:MAG: type I glyceraldehyde-3-phosphate dehydrogenase [Candidatus Doudnabacteria bacterium CG10_big_fil_rev_8_21_14_0_10_41_10]|uniref:Type I glyceraldehyde-3-phosphate dehydrogenase n=1 Tax=Candidatus Doudnabacteria bacterium CG10_big_fil_rev_8_21_14_0_10_41_10 TaxID=1974551 RepID=A0A2H0VGD0_9BACT|nr:MAG: type I glyceraldehyde-3-phosphate dehydrogenase [Candidatus Doudnabacteria bacterium CG10_big_fil_rev_8_21_14_0_10_41_10]
MAKARVAINGFGRIGRAAFKIGNNSKSIEFVAINDLSPVPTLAHLLKYDSVYGRYIGKVEAADNALVVDKKKILVFAENDPKKLQWKKLKVDVVLECTGKFVKDGAAKVHIEAGAKRVIVSAPAKGEGDVKTFLLGVNEKEYKQQKVISNASCTTNCVAPVAFVLQKNFGIEKGMVTTVHAYTGAQSLVDGNNKDLRRARSAAINIIPTTTGAAIATGEVVSGLENRFDGMAIRVPVVNGSLSDFTVLLKRNTTVEELNKALVEYAKKNKEVMEVTTDPIVSTDIIGNSHSAIVDLSLTKVVGGNLVKVFAWYDNEWGYANRLVEEIALVT